MAVTAVLSNHFKYQQNAGNIDFSADNFKAILMGPSFAFDKDAHATLADVTADQLATGNGYTQDDEAISVLGVDEDDTNDRSNVTLNDVSWTASGGSIGPFGALVIYDDTTADDTIVGCIDLGTDYTISDGFTFLLQDAVLRLT